MQIDGQRHIEIALFYFTLYTIGIGYLIHITASHTSNNVKNYLYAFKKAGLIPNTYNTDAHKRTFCSAATIGNYFSF